MWFLAGLSNKTVSGMCYQGGQKTFMLYPQAASLSKKVCPAFLITNRNIYLCDRMLGRAFRTITSTKRRD